MPHESAIFRGLTQKLAADRPGANKSPGAVQPPMTPTEMENKELQDRLTNIQLKLHLQNAEQVVQAQQQQQEQEAAEAEQASVQQQQASAQAVGGGATPGVPQRKRKPFAGNPAMGTDLPVDPQGMIGAG